MKRLITLTLFMTTVLFSFSQNKTLPSVDIKTIDGEVNPLRKQLRHIRYKKYIDTYGIG